MQNTRLFIENQEVELDESVQFAITKQFDDLTNPTVIINDWSKTVEIPFTTHNNRLFGSLYNPDRALISSTDEFKTGMKFDPYKKLDFRLEWNGTLLMNGYAKLNTITQNNGRGTYNITLNGQLGKLFQEMKKITFDRSTEDPKYLIDGKQYFEATMNAGLISNCWDNPLGTVGVPTEPASRYIGFAPCEVLQEEDIDYKLFQFNREIKELKDVLGDSFKDATGIAPENIIDKGISPRGLGEFRSYKQIPYIHFRSLYNIFKNKAEEVTGYTINLDQEWRNSAANFDRLAFILKRFDAKNAISYNNTYNYLNADMEWKSKADTRDGYNPYGGSGRVAFLTPNTYNEQYSIYKGDGLFSLDDISLVTVKGLGLKFTATLNNSISSDHTWRIHPNSALILTIAVSDTNSIIRNINFAIVDEDTTVNVSDCDYVINFPRQTTTSIGDTISVNIPVPDINIKSDKFKIAMMSVWRDNSSDSTITRWQYKSGSMVVWSNLNIGDMKVSMSDAIQIDVTPDFYRTGYKFTLNDLWDNEHNIFAEMLKYTKMYNLIWSVDESTKTINILPRDKYFRDYNIVDWTDKLDMTKDFTITPISWEDKYVLFNYADSKLGLNESYREKYGYSFGEKRIATDYNFNEETRKLFDDITLGFAYSPNVLSWTTLYEQHKIAYTLPNEQFIYCQDKDGKYVNIFGTLILNNGLASFDPVDPFRQVILTDDTDYQISINKYCYTQDADPSHTIRRSTYPKLSNIYGEYHNLYAKPKENYTSDTHAFDSVSGAIGVYDRCWERYISERYNVQNKKLTAYISLRPSDFINFEFNRFVRIENQLYFVNKIYDYDITSTESTKVDLITVQNLSGYTS